MKTLVLASVLFLLAAAPAVAQNGTVVSGVFNAASWIPAGLPSHGIAQGSMFVVLGSGLGPDALVFPGVLPLPTTMEGTSIEVTVDGVTVGAFMVYTWTNQVAAVLPSTIPAGLGTLTLTYNGETSAPVAILVVSSAFGIFTRNQSGYGPAIVQNWISPTEAPRLNSLIDSAIGNQYEILWGSGLGAIPGDDSGLPPVGNLEVDVQVLVGGRPAVIHYKGRSAQFPAIDQIQFQAPPSVEGCYVPVVVIVSGVVSNFSTMAINSAGGRCSDSVSFSAADLDQAAQGGDSRLGGIVVNGINYGGPGIPAGQGYSGVLAGFGSATSAAMLNSLGPVGFFLEMPPTSMGACYVYQGAGTDMDVDDRTPIAELRAGEVVNMTAPFGTVELEYEDSAYGVEAQANLAGPGLYTFNNGAGGDDVGSFQTSLSIPDTQFAWTDRDSIQSISRAEALTVTWTGGDDSREFVVVVGHSARTDLDVMGLFICAERVSAGQLTLEPWLLSTLPASSPWAGGEDDVPYSLTVGRMSRLDRNRFTAPGLDGGFLFYVLADNLIAPYE